MRSGTKRVLAAALLVLLSSPGVFGQDGAVSEQSIRQLVGQLADGDWHVRQKAQKQLALIGAPVAPFLEESAQSAIFEVRFRAREILRGIRFVTPGDSAAIEKCISEFDPEADKDKQLKLVIALRRIKNIRFYLLEKMLGAKGQEREKIASLLARVEYRISGRRIDSGISYATDILLSLVRDELVGADLRLRALRGLMRLADNDSAASLVDWLGGEERDEDLADAALRALEKLAGQKGAGDNGDRKAKIMAWWSEVSAKTEFAAGCKHLELRKKLEAKEAEQEVPFLGVAKDQDFPDMGGAHVLYPVEESGAGKAGVQAGDVIIEFDGRPVDNWDDMVFGLQRSRIGDKALLKVRRGGKEVELQATLTRRTEGQ